MSLTMGSGRLWLPSRKSVASQRGALSITLLGHWRLGRSNGLKGLYFVEGSLSLWETEISLEMSDQLRSLRNIHRHGGVWRGVS